MKKVVCAIMAVLMLIGICACGGTEAGTKFSIGEWNGNVYTNEFAGLTFNQPDGWSHASDEELVEMLGVALEAGTDDNELVQKIAEMSNSYALYAASADSTNNVQLLFENLAMTGNKDMSVEEYINLVSSQIEAQYASYGMTCTLDDITTVTICGNEYSRLDITVDAMGATIEQTYAVRKIDKYMANIIISAYGEGGVDTILGYFA